MILAILIAVLLIGGFLVLAVGQRYPTASRWISLLFVGFDFAATLVFWSGKWGRSSMPTEGAWLADLNWNWIPSFGIRLHLAIDGFSLPQIPPARDKAQAVAREGKKRPSPNGAGGEPRLEGIGEQQQH